jgi:hypothetical protein
MKRLVVAAACAVAVVGGAAPALAADPTPTPTTSEATPAPSPTVSLDPNTREVCTKSAATVTKGVAEFTTELGKVSTAATSGDLTTAEASVKKAGAILITLSDDLNADAQSAENPEVKSALEDVANEFDKLGSSLTGLSSLQTFDTQRLEALSDRMSSLCGG